MTVPDELSADLSSDAIDWGTITLTATELLDYGEILNTATATEDWGLIISDSVDIVFQTSMAFQSGWVEIFVGTADANEEALGASLTIGPFNLSHFVEEPHFDRLISSQEAKISMLDSGIDDTLIDYIENYINAEVIVDWDTLVGEEDWGIATGSYTDYSLLFKGTIDGYTTWNPNDVLQEVEPELIEQISKTRLVAGSVSGSYLFIDITADKLGELFQLKQLKFNVTDIGELY